MVVLAENDLCAVPLFRRVGAALSVIMQNLGMSDDQRAEVLGWALWPGPHADNSGEPGRTTKRERDQAVALVRAGRSRQDVAEFYGVDAHTVG